MASAEHNHVLYYSTFSVCSVMVRLSFACRGEAKDAEQEVVMKEEHVELGMKEQLTEHFLCNVNSYGEVPVLVPQDKKPIPDSLAITLHLSTIYPNLIPSEHSSDIKRLLEELHNINYFSLSFAGKPQSPLDTLKTLRNHLEENISEDYRAAILVKIKRVEKEKLSTVSADEVEGNIKRTEAIMDKLHHMLEQSHSGWFFGVEQPSALDAHLLGFIARLQDVGRDSLIPAKLKQWADNFMQRREWKDLMKGVRTLPPALLSSSRS